MRREAEHHAGIDSGMLREIERTQQVKILYAAEAGSRAWGFALSDSDYDVRFLNLRWAEVYLKIDCPRDVIEWRLDESTEDMTEELDTLFFKLLSAEGKTICGCGPFSPHTSMKP